MRISHKYKFIYLAFPRTASSSVRKLLDPYSDIESTHKTQTTEDFPFYHHMSARELKTVFDQRGWDWFAYKRFCVVRNPYHRVVSLFRHRMEKNATKHAEMNIANSLFNLFYLKAPRQWAFPLFVFNIRPSSGVSKNLQAFISADDGTPLVDDILRFEKLSEELPTYLYSLGITSEQGQLPHLNFSKDRTPYTSWYTPFTKKQVEKKFSYEITKFGYVLE